MLTLAYIVAYFVFNTLKEVNIMKTIKIIGTVVLFGFFIMNNVIAKSDKPIKKTDTKTEAKKTMLSLTIPTL